ncbi:MAG TPA: hypothetical protein DCY03_12765 [Planctomycetaceae bacterium]|nr:hypothetical protein [Planctomycetaceae bacterium]|tara:strand:+ start:18841 stop:20850 length:2010 start_codon:yes stop_codon:yes gene_type:complete
MKTGTPSLLTLIKLREGQLSPAAGVAVRERLAADSKLLIRWKQLSQIADQKLTLDDASDHAGRNAEKIAAYIEERLTPAEHKAFESTCWQADALIREVIAAFQAARFDESAADLSEKYSQQVMQTTQRMSEFVHRELQQHKGACSAGSDPGSIEDHANSVVSQLPAERVRLARSPGASSHTDINKRKMLYGIAVVLLITVLPAYFLWNREARTVQKKTIAVIPEQKQTPVTPAPLEQNQPDSDPELAVIPPEQHRERRPIVFPDVDDTLPTPPLVAQKPGLANLEHAGSLSLNWSQLMGVAGVRNKARSDWQGILSAGQELDLNTGSRVRIRTLPFSWLQAKLSLGETGLLSDFVLDADTEVELMIKSNQQTAPGLQAELDLSLRSGQIALSQLHAGSVIYYHTQSKIWLLEIQQDDTEVAFMQQETGLSELMVFSGALQFSDTASREVLTLKPEQKLILKAERISVPLKLSGNHRWRTGPAKSFPLNSTFVAELNQSEDLLAALMQASPDRSRLEQQSGVNLGINLDPQTAVPQATVSRSELQRTAAIDWLLTTRDKPSLTAVWKQIAQNTGVHTASPAIQTWFQVARGEIPGGSGLVAELSAGLDASQPLFTRQCSIHFLRQLTRQPLAEYDPDSPSPVTINSVRQKLRRLTGTKNQPGRNTPRRQQ